MALEGPFSFKSADFSAINTVRIAAELFDQPVKYPSQKKGPDNSTFQASYPAVKGTANGGWEIDRDSSGETSVILNLYIKSGEVRLAAACTKNNGATVTLSITSPAVITETTIEVLESKEVSDDNGAINCRASIKKGKMNYKILADDSLSIEGGASVKPIY